MSLSSKSSASANFAVLQSVRSALAKRSPRERLIVLGLVLLVGLTLLWQLALKPAWQTLRDVPARQAELDKTWQSMQSLAQQARVWQALPNKSVAEVRQQLETTARSCFGATAVWQPQGDAVQVQLQQAAVHQLAQCLVQLPVNAAQLQRQSNGTWSGSLSLRWPQE